jgi:CBS domain containing-hemolysin-like protein
MVLTLALLAAAAFVGSRSPWALALVLVVGCGAFVAFEFSLVKVPVRQLERDAAEGRSGAGTLLQMKRDMNAMLAACQFGITLTSLGLTLALEPALHRALAPHAALAEHSAAIAMTLGTFFHVTFGELVPKGVALVVPAQVLYFTAPLMGMFRWVAVPFIKTCNGIANVAVTALTGHNPDKAGSHDEGMEIGEALLYAHASGQIQPDQLKLMRNVLAFSERIAREVMTPAKDVASVDLKAPWSETLRRVEEARYSRFLVTDGAWHKVVGYVRKADVLRAELRERRNLQSFVIPIERLPVTVALSRINIFEGCPIIALYDEHDSFVGVITAEDVVEQIVGEIYDEKDPRVAPRVERLSEEELRMDGELLLAEAAEPLGLRDLSEHEDIDTVGGLVLKLLARQPSAGDEVTVGDYHITVEDAQGFRITKLRCVRVREPATEEAAVEV